jgi:flagellar hook-length control protein FliK
MTGLEEESILGREISQKAPSLQTTQNPESSGTTLSTTQQSSLERIASFESIVVQGNPQPEETLAHTRGPDRLSTPFSPRFLALTSEAVEKKWGIVLPRNTVLLQLEPKELGSLLVEVRLTGGKHLEASFWAESSTVRTLLQSHLSALNQVLTQQGLQPQQLSVGSPEGFSQQFSHSSQQQSSFHSSAQGGGQGWEGQRRSNHADGISRRNADHHQLVDVLI